MIIQYIPTKYKCEKCLSTVSKNSNFCDVCGHDLRKENIYECDDNQVKKDMDEHFRRIGIAP